MKELDLNLREVRSVQHWNTIAEASMIGEFRGLQMLLDGVHFKLFQVSCQRRSIVNVNCSNYMGVSINGGTPKWIDYKGKSD